MTRDEILNMPAGRKLDALIAKHVMKLPDELIHDEAFEYKGHKVQGNSYYSHEDTYSFVDVVFQMQELGYRYEMRGGWKGDSNHVAMFDESEWADNNPLYKAYAENLPLAVCRAALLAVLDAGEKQAEP